MSRRRACRADFKTGCLRVAWRCKCENREPQCKHIQTFFQDDHDQFPDIRKSCVCSAAQFSGVTNNARSLPRSRRGCGEFLKGNIKLTTKKEILDFKPERSEGETRNLLSGFCRSIRTDDMPRRHPGAAGRRRQGGNAEAEPDLFPAVAPDFSPSWPFGVAGAIYGIVAAAAGAIMI